MSRARIHLWYDVCWPVAAGLVTGLGLVAAYLWTGPRMFLVALAVLELTVAPVAWSVLTELGFGVRSVVLRLAPAVSVAALAVVGLADLIGPWTFPVAAAVLATSPAARGWTHGDVRRTMTERVSPRTRTRRRFDEIVANGFGASDEDRPPR